MTPPAIWHRMNDAKRIPVYQAVIVDQVSTKQHCLMLDGPINK